MSITVAQSATAITPGLQAGFTANGGTAPYTWSVAPGGAGGSIDINGTYSSVTQTEYNASASSDTIIATDSLGATGSAIIVVGPPVLIVCDIIQREMGLAPGRTYLWDQKVMKPADSGIFVVVSVANTKVFGLSNRYVPAGSNLTSGQMASVAAQIDINIISRGPGARDRKEEIVLALNGTYAQQQQTANGFYIARLPIGGKFLNLSDVDGAAIPYRYQTSFMMQYAYAKSKNVDFYDTLTGPTNVTDP